jgi:predicted RNA-binding Zn ribbon-like protein
VDEPVEWIACGEDLLAWLAQAKLAPGDVLDHFRANTLPRDLDTVAAQARSLREWFRGFVDDHQGERLRPGALAELEPLNKILARDEAFGRIVARPRDQGHEAKSGLDWQSQRRWRSPDTLLLPVARVLADLVTEEDFTRVKGCKGSGCVLFFVDRTHGAARRWCSMAICGNRAKQTSLRERLQGRKARRR